MLALGLQVFTVLVLRAYTYYTTDNLDLRPFMLSQLCRVRYKWLHLPIRQEVAASHLRVLHDILGRCGIHFWLTEGTALGAIREGRVIPTDTDIDRHTHSLSVTHPLSGQRISIKTFSKFIKSYKNL